MAEKTEPQRQIVNFVGYKLDPGWRMLSDEKKKEDRTELCRVLSRWSIADRMLILGYSLVGIRADVDIMLWRIPGTLRRSAGSPWKMR